MQPKNILRYFLIILPFVLMACYANAIQRPVTAEILANNALQDSIRLQARQDSVDALFATTYSKIIYVNPNRTPYLSHWLEQQFEKAGSTKIIGEQYFNNAPTDVEDGTDKRSRPIWVLVVTLSLFLFVGLIKVIFPIEFRIIIEAYYRERLLQQVSKEDSIATSWPYVFLYVVFSLALGLFIVIFVSEFRDHSFLSLSNYLKASGIIAVLFIIKILIVRFVSVVFELDRIVREYVAVIYLVYFNSMLFLLPFLLLSVFLPTSYFNILLILFVSIIVILFVYRMLRTALHLLSNTKFSISYLIIYLCTLEIAPILLLIRSLDN